MLGLVMIYIGCHLSAHNSSVLNLCAIVFKYGFCNEANVDMTSYTGRLMFLSNVL